MRALTLMGINVKVNVHVNVHINVKVKTMNAGRAVPLFVVVSAFQHYLIQMAFGIVF